MNLSEIARIAALFDLKDNDLSKQRSDLAKVLADNPDPCRHINDLIGPPYAFVSLGFRFDMRRIDTYPSGYFLTIGNSERNFFIKDDGYILGGKLGNYEALDPISFYLLSDMIIRVVGSQKSK